MLAATFVRTVNVPGRYDDGRGGLGFTLLVQPSSRRGFCDLALAHVNSDRVEAAYRRSDLFEERRKLMDDWAGYIASTDT